jgi:hypothetical protein
MGGIKMKEFNAAEHFKNRYEIKHIEADVIIHLTSEDTGKGKTILFWECDYTQEQLHKVALFESISFNEFCGVGEVMYDIIDFRESEVI